MQQHQAQGSQKAEEGKAQGPGHPQEFLIFALALAMIRKAFVMSVDPQFHAEYEKRHRPIWPELEAVLKEHGVHNYSIHLDESTHQLFGYAEIESEERWAAIAQTEICRKRWNYMKDVMPSNPDGSPVARDIREVFYLE